jgi:RHS repeat-associated protein
VLVTDIGRENVHGSARADDGPSLMAAKKKWWTPVTDAPPFWTVSPDPGPPTFRPAPQNGPPDWAPAANPHAAEPLPASMEPWWVPAPPDEEDSSASIESTRTTLWARLLGNRDRVPVALAIASEPLITEPPAPLAAVGSRRYSFYTPELQLMAETERTTAPNPGVAYDYVWFAGQPLAQIETTTGTIHWYFNDHLGTPILQTDSTASVVWRAEYDPYGNVVQNRAGATKHQPLRFPGQENDGTSETSYNIFRWYRAAWGRYTQADPIGFHGGDLNVYRYAAGNPLTNTDPTGEAAVSNQSSSIIWIKPETGNEPTPMMPGSSADADGIYQNASPPKFGAGKCDVILKIAGKTIGGLAIGGNMIVKQNDTGLYYTYMGLGAMLFDLVSPDTGWHDAKWVKSVGWKLPPWSLPAGCECETE